MDYIDSNLILRFMLNDPKAEKVEKLLKSNKKLAITDVNICEIVWVLESFYKKDRSFIVNVLTGLLNLGNIESNKDVFLKTLKYYKNYKVDFIDAYLSSVGFKDKANIYSYDKDLDKIPDIKRLEP